MLLQRKRFIYIEQIIRNHKMLYRTFHAFSSLFKLRHDLYLGFYCCAAVAVCCWDWSVIRADNQSSGFVILPNKCYEMNIMTLFNAIHVKYILFMQFQALYLTGFRKAVWFALAQVNTNYSNHSRCTAVVM